MRMKGGVCRRGYPQCDRGSSLPDLLSRRPALSGIRVRGDGGNRDRRGLEIRMESRRYISPDSPARASEPGSHPRLSMATLDPHVDAPVPPRDASSHPRVAPTQCGQVKGRDHAPARVSFCNGTLREHHFGHERPPATTHLHPIPPPYGTFVPAAARPCPPFPPRRSMVRRGSTVRVRQRALAKYLQIEWSSCLRRNRLSRAGARRH
jgi:hypothetical protein